MIVVIAVRRARSFPWLRRGAILIESTLAIAVVVAVLALSLGLLMFWASHKLPDEHVDALGDIASAARSVRAYSGTYTGVDAAALVASGELLSSHRTLLSGAFSLTRLATRVRFDPLPSGAASSLGSVMGVDSGTGFLLSVGSVPGDPTTPALTRSELCSRLLLWRPPTLLSVSVQTGSVDTPAATGANAATVWHAPAFSGLTVAQAHAACAAAAADPRGARLFIAFN